MKWFRHDTDCIRNRKIRKIVREHGLEGYGIWMALLEYIYANEENFTVTVDALWLEDMADDWRLPSAEHLSAVLESFARLGLIDANAWQEGIIQCPGIIERSDSYMAKRCREAEKKRRQRSVQKSGQSPPAGTSVPMLSPPCPQDVPDVSPGDKVGTRGQNGNVPASDADANADADADTDANAKKKYKPKKGSNQSEPLAHGEQPLKNCHERNFIPAMEPWQDQDGEVKRNFVEWMRQRLDGTAYYQERGGATFYNAEQRILKLAKENQGLLSSQWQEFCEAGGTVAINIKAEVLAETRRLGLQSVLPPDWQDKTGQVLYAELTPQELREYLAWLKQQPNNIEHSARI